MCKCTKILITLPKFFEIFQFFLKKILFLNNFVVLICKHITVSNN